MADMKINAKFQMNLSLESVEEYKEFLEKYASKLPQIAENIVNKVSDIGLDNNYNSTTKIPIVNTGNKVIGGIKTNDVGETYAEFGTGMVGRESPHVADWIAKSGWKYDVNEHGEKGWVYYKDGQFHWTAGIPAKKKFYEASEKMEENFPIIAREEFMNFNS